MTTVTKLQQPFRKRLRMALSKLRPKDGAATLATIMVVLAFIDDMRGHTDKATYMIALAIFIMVLSDRSETK